MSGCRHCLSKSTQWLHRAHDIPRRLPSPDADRYRALVWSVLGGAQAIPLDTWRLLSAHCMQTLARAKSFILAPRLSHKRLRATKQPWIAKSQVGSTLCMLAAKSDERKQTVVYAVAAAGLRMKPASSHSRGTTCLKSAVWSRQGCAGSTTLTARLLVRRPPDHSDQVLRATLRTGASAIQLTCGRCSVMTARKGSYVLVTCGGPSHRECEYCWFICPMSDASTPLEAYMQGSEVLAHHKHPRVAGLGALGVSATLLGGSMMRKVQRRTRPAAMALRPRSPPSGSSCCTARLAVSRLSRKLGSTPARHRAGILQDDHPTRSVTGGRKMQEVARYGYDLCTFERIQDADVRQYPASRARLETAPDAEAAKLDQQRRARRIREGPHRQAGLHAVNLEDTRPISAL